MSPQQSPTVLYIRAALEAAGHHGVRVEDDQATAGVLVGEGRIVVVGKMSGGWVTDDKAHGGRRVDPTLMQHIVKVLPYEPNGGRASRHQDWRRQHNPPICDNPQVGDSAVSRGRRYVVVEVSRFKANHKSLGFECGDIAWIRVTCPESKRGRPRSITLYEWATWKDHQRPA